MNPKDIYNNFDRREKEQFAFAYALFVDLKKSQRVSDLDKPAIEVLAEYIKNHKSSYYKEKCERVVHSEPIPKRHTIHFAK